MTMLRRAVALVAIISALLLSSAGVALAHPLGNFTVNQYVGIRVAPGSLTVDYVLDMAEIPAFRETRRIDLDGDGSVEDTESETYRSEMCAALARGLSVAHDGADVQLTAEPGGLAFPAGQAGLVTLRLDCTFAADLDHEGGSFVIGNRNHAERLGWNEVVVSFAGVIGAADVPAVSASARLTAFPAGPPLDVRGATVDLDASGGVAVVTSGPGSVDRPIAVEAFASLIDRAGLGVGGTLLALAAAVGLGIVHALAPGHGKTVMAAYLVGRNGRMRDAATLGLAVAMSHTIGVLVLAVAVLLASHAFDPKAVYPYLSLVSGLIVFVIGAGLLFRILRVRRAAHRHDGLPAGHHHDHHHGDGHHHGHHHGPTADDGERPSRLAMIGLGLTGGLAPSASAVVLMLGAMHLGRFELGVVLILAFGIGMAIALVGVGLGLVVAARFGIALMADGAGWRRAATMAAPAAASVVIGLGVWMTLGAVQAVGA